ncbi:MAG TPA: XRE family transcriptional regulator [Chloroflexota bacterium]|nr:XRE family transcriptional regulator [Chloroflexota bacterium]
MRELGAVIRRERETRSLTQGELGEMVGVTHSGISKIENGRQDGTDYILLRNLASALGSDVRVFESILRDEPLPRPAVPMPEITREVPRVANVSAGPGALVDGYEYVSLSDTRGRNLAAATVTGECMMPELRPGDVVIFDRNQRTPRNGQTVVAVIHEPGGDIGIVKRFFKLNGKVKLEPLVGQPLIVAAEDVRIEGVVVEVRRRY